MNGCNGLQYEVNGAQVTAVIITLAERSVLFFACFHILLHSVRSISGSFDLCSGNIFNHLPP